MHIHDEIAESVTTGLKIFRRTVTPATTEIRGVFLMLHGLGDHQGCHLEAAELIAHQGFASIGFDWPGNGASEGKRGDLPGIQVAFSLIDEHIALCRTKFEGKSIGLYAHSTGGFLALRHQTLREENPYRWIWLSSPLLNPRHKQPRLLQAIAPHIAEILPTFTVRTGVTLEKCRHLDPANPRPGTHRIEGRHGKISLRFGADLLFHADDLEAVGAIIQDPTEFLITQGSEDEICPPEFSHSFFEKIATSQKSYALIHGLRHEMLREPANDEFMEVVETWVEELKA